MEEFKIKINNMNDKELKENILRYNDDKLNNINKSSYLNSFGAIISIVDVLEKKEEFDYLKDLSEVNLFKEYVETAVELLNKSLYKIDDSKNLETAKNNRNNLYDLLKIVEGYYIELSYVGNLVDYYGLKIKSKDHDIKNKDVNVENIINLIHEVLEKHKSNYSAYNYIVSQIIQFIPMRLTKDKYISIVEDSIKRNLKSRDKKYIEDKIDYYKRQWNSSFQYGYGLKFDKYFAEIQKFKNEDIKNKDINQLDSQVDTIISLTRDINELYNFILILGLIYNMIIVIYSIGNDSLDKDIIKIMDEWNEVLESKNEQRKQKIIKSNEEKIREIEIDTFSDIEMFQELSKEAVKRKEFIDKELEEIFSYTKEILTYYNDYNLGNIDLILNKDAGSASDEYLDEWVNSLISYIKRSLKNMDNANRKVRMKKFLSLIELPFASIIEFEDYIRYSLNSRISSSKESLFIGENIVSFIKNIDNKIKN